MAIPSQNSLDERRLAPYPCFDFRINHYSRTSVVPTIYLRFFSTRCSISLAVVCQPATLTVKDDQCIAMAPQTPRIVSWR